MLVYRKVNSEKNISIVPDEEVTSHLREIILAENSLFEQEKLIEKQKKDKIYVNVFWDQKSKSVLTDRSHTLAELIVCFIIFINCLLIFINNNVI